MSDCWDIRVDCGGKSINNLVAEYALDDFTPDTQRPYLQVMELNATGEIVDPNVTCQLDQNDGSAKAVFLLGSRRTEFGARYFRLRLTDREPACEPLLALGEGVVYQEQESYEIATQTAMTG